MRVNIFFFFQAEDGIRDLVRSRGLGDVYKRQGYMYLSRDTYTAIKLSELKPHATALGQLFEEYKACLLYTSDAADDLLCVDLGGRRIIKKKTNY